MPRTPELEAALNVGCHKIRVEGWNPFPWPAATPVLMQFRMNSLCTLGVFWISYSQLCYFPNRCLGGWNLTEWELICVMLPVAGVRKSHQQHHPRLSDCSRATLQVSFVGSVLPFNPQTLILCLFSRGSFSQSPFLNTEQNTSPLLSSLSLLKMVWFSDCSAPVVWLVPHS